MHKDTLSVSLVRPQSDGIPSGSARAEGGFGVGADDDRVSGCVGQVLRGRGALVDIVSVDRSLTMSLYSQV